MYLFYLFLSGGILKKYDLIENRNNAGEIRLVIYTDGELISGYGDLAYISFEISTANGTGEINLTQFDINKMSLSGGLSYDKNVRFCKWKQISQ